MKIKTITHEQSKERKNDITKESFIKDPIYHPFMLEREYIRSLNYTKLERMLSKPFVAALSWHPEGIYSMKREGDNFMTASFDGTVIIWDMQRRDIILRTKFEFIPIISFCQSNFLIGDDGVITRYGYNSVDNNIIGDIRPVLKYKIENKINSLDHFNNQIFVTTLDGCFIYDPERITYKQKYGNEEYFCTNFSNPLPHIIGLASRREVVLLDDRSQCEFARFKSGIKTTDLSFNPINNSYLVTANEDSNAYLYDLRYIGKKVRSWINHVNSVVSVDYSSNGRDVVTGSLDKTLRIYNEEGCKDVYYNRRMGNVNGVNYSEDGRFIISASDDGAIRLWKGEHNGIRNRREEDAIKYASAVKEKFADLPEIKRISRHRFLPKKLKNDIKREVVKYQAGIRKKERIKNNNNPNKNVSLNEQ